MEQKEANTETVIMKALVLRDSNHYSDFRDEYVFRMGSENHVFFRKKTEVLSNFVGVK